MFRINIYCTFIVLGAAASSSPAGGTIQEFTVNEDWESLNNRATC